MAPNDKPILPAKWRVIVDNVPLVSVDLVIEHDGVLLLGKRENEPAKGEWFVPGGTVLKNESRRDAVHRVAREELGEDVVIDSCLGTFEHFYDTADVDDVDSKHYVATAYRCHFKNEHPDIASDSQHRGLKIFEPPSNEFHRNIQRYLDESQLDSD